MSAKYSRCDPRVSYSIVEVLMSIGVPRTPINLWTRHTKNMEVELRPNIQPRTHEVKIEAYMPVGMAMDGYERHRGNALCNAGCVR